MTADKVDALVTLQLPVESPDDFRLGAAGIGDERDAVGAELRHAPLAGRRGARHLPRRARLDVDEHRLAA